MSYWSVEIIKIVWKCIFILQIQGITSVVDRCDFRKTETVKGTRNLSIFFLSQ